MKSVFVFSLLLIAIIIPGISVAQGDNPGTACREAAKLFDENDIEAALEEARWCVEGLQQIKQQQTAKIFPDEINGFKGGEIEQQSAMGMNMLERSYTRGREAIDVNFTGGGAGGGLAAIARMGMAMGSGAGKKMRIQRQVVLDMSEGDKAEFTATLKNGGVLNISSHSAKYDDVLEFIKAFPLGDLDKATAN